MDEIDDKLGVGGMDMNDEDEERVGEDNDDDDDKGG